jgi:hypothetical protein
MLMRVYLPLHLVENETSICLTIGDVGHVSSPLRCLPVQGFVAAIVIKGMMGVLLPHSRVITRNFSKFDASRDSKGTRVDHDSDWQYSRFKNTPSNQRAKPLRKC